MTHAGRHRDPPVHASTSRRADLDDLHDRLDRAHWPDELPGDGDYGVTPVVRPLTWPTTGGRGYDWRAVEARLNAYPQFTTEIDGQNIHFLHVRSPEPDALPLILTHGWPGSIVEYLDIIEPLTDPRATAATRRDAFHLVIPSMPGLRLLRPDPRARLEPTPHRRGVGRADAPPRLRALRRGRQRRRLDDLARARPARPRPRRRRARHPDLLVPLGRPGRDGRPDRGGAGASWARSSGSSRTSCRSTSSWRSSRRPWATRSADSPLGLLAWNAQLLGEDLDPDFVLANVTLYWLTGTATSAARLLLRERPRRPSGRPSRRPCRSALAAFGGDFSGIRRFAERDHPNIVRWTTYDHGGHFAAHKAPDLLIDDIREFYAGLRPGRS